MPRVQSGSPAADAGLRPGDVITAIDGHEVRNAAHLSNLIGLVPVGESLDIAFYRDGRRHTTAATVGGIRQAALTVAKRVPQLAGAIFQDIGRDSSAYGRIHGVLIAEVARGSPAWRYGLRAGDIVTDVNRQPVRSLEELREALDSVERAIVLSLVRDNTRMILVIQ